MITVHHFGIHHAGSVGFLLQGKKDVQSIYGVESPFEMGSRNTSLTCLHAIELSERDSTHAELLEDPLFQWLSRPSGPAVVVDGPPVQLIEQAMEIFSPVRPMMRHAWGTPVETRELRLTNLAPLVLFDASHRNMMTMRMALTYPRPLLALSHEPIPTVPTIHTAITKLPDQRALRRLGAWIIYERLKCPS